VTRVAIGFNDPKPPRRSALCAIDINKAFDSINHILLIKHISASDLHHNVIRWLAAYIRGCKASCICGSSKSKPMILRSGVPQGSVLSPTLFNFFVSDCPLLTNILLLYADYFSALESDSDLESLCWKLQEGITPITEWAARKKLKIAADKSQVILFTPHNLQFNSQPDVSINCVNVPLCRSPKILGVTFDTMFCFHKHILEIVAKATKRINLIKALSGSSWGQDKETLLLTFKALVESVFNYTAAIWFLNCKPSNIAKLETIQNEAMRLITGCHKASSIKNLHAECKLLPVVDSQSDARSW
jgi:hypothetical protein